MYNIHFAHSMLTLEQVNHWFPATFSSPLSPPTYFLLLFFCRSAHSLQVLRKWWCLMAAPSWGWSHCNHRSIIKRKALIMATPYLQTVLFNPSCRGFICWGRGGETGSNLPVKIKITKPCSVPFSKAGGGSTFESGLFFIHFCLCNLRNRFVLACLKSACGCGQRARWGESDREEERERKKKRDGPPHYPLLQCLSALPGWLVMEPGVPLLLAPGPAPGLLRCHLAGEAPAFPGPLLLPHPVCPDLRTPLPAPPPRLPTFCTAGLHHLGSSAGHPPALPVHLPQVDTFLYYWHLECLGTITSNKLVTPSHVLNVHVTLMIVSSVQNMH